jgi:uncharacterized protein
MFKRVHLSLLALLALGIAGTAFAATDATPHQIYEAAQSGHMAEAQQMIDQVLRDHPQNAKAHFIASELDTRIGDLAAARQQLATAKQLDPTLAFASAPALSALERQLTGMRAVIPGSGVGSQAFAPAVRHSSVPWGLIIILAIGAFVLWSIFRSRAQRAYAQTYGPGALPPGNPGMQPGYGPGYPPPGGGSGLMGSLASGLAIGAGVAAGEELVRHVIDGNGNVVPAPAADLRDPPQNQDMGGNDFGTQDGSSWGNDSGGGDSGGGWGGDSGGGGGGDWT